MEECVPEPHRPGRRRLFALLLLLQASGRLADDEEGRKENECFVVVQGDANYRPAEFFDGIIAWTASGAPPDVWGAGLEILAKPINFAINRAAEEMTLSCRWSMLSISMASLLLTNQGEEPWPLFVSIPFEDMARARWPAFELISIWGERERRRQEANHSAFTQQLFWRTCPDQEAAEFWTKREVSAAGMAMRATSLHAGTQVTGAVARGGAIALLKYVDRSSWSHTTGLCGVLPWALVTHSLAVAQGSRALVGPGYSLRLFQAMLQEAYREGPPEDFMLDAVAAPWPVLTMLAEVAYHERLAHPVLDTVTVDSSPEAAKFAHTESSRIAQLMDTMRVAHAMLQSMGISYLAIAGTLLGALRHMQVIPWDDDIDLCVDALHEPKLFSLVLAEESLRLGLDWPHGLSWKGQRAVKLLRREGHVIKIEASRSMTFRIVRAAADGGGDNEAPYVDIWHCWDTAHPEHWDKSEDGPVEPAEPTVVLMSKKYGPRIPRSFVYPRKKMPFGNMAVWAPADPYEVTRRYLTHGGWSEDFMNTCEGQKVHGEEGNSEYTDSVPCNSLGAFAGPWKVLAPGPETEEAFEAVSGVVRERLPGLEPPEPSDLTVQAATLGEGRPPRLRARGWLRAGVGRKRLWCEALIWRGDKPEEDLLQPGARPNTGQVLRSFTCGEPGAEPSLIWEEAWMT